VVAAHLIVATRQSPLARAQTEEALAVLRPLLPADTTLEVRPLTTPGDRDLQTPLTDPAVPDDFFTQDLDRALLEGRADLAVHSAKDLPRQPVPGLQVAALLPARDIREALVVRSGLTPSAVRTVGTSSPRRETELRKLYPEARPVPLRGTIQQRLARLDAGDYDAVIMAACALDRLGLAHRITEYLPFEPVPQQGRLAIVVRADRPDLLAALRPLDVRRTAGLVALVGCSADPALQSHRAETYLRHADVVFHDRLVPGELLQQVRGKAVAVGKAGGGPSTPQLDIHRQLLQEAEQGKLVVRLHGGDPGIYGHMGEEIEFLTAWNIRCDVVPALSAAQVAAAHARAPLTHRGAGHRVTLVTAKPGQGHGHEEAPLPGPAIGNLAVYMGVRSAAQVAEKLATAGWPATAPIVVGERLGYPDERIRYTSAGELATLALETPAVFLVGMRSFPSQQFTLFTGTDPDHFLRYGPLLHWPLIRLESRPLAERQQHLKDLLPGVRGLLFPSRFAVQSFLEALLQDGDVRALHGKLVLAVGPATEQELRQHGVRADGAADNLGGVQALAGRLTPEFTGRFLYPCSDASPQPDRITSLRAHGIELVPSVFYQNREAPPRDLPRLPFNRVLFTSTSTVHAYFRHYPQERTAARAWLAVGPSTLKALQEMNLEAEILQP
jgi:uroporphyrinogen III methyltransferase/synthase